MDDDMYTDMDRLRARVELLAEISDDIMSVVSEDLASSEEFRSGTALCALGIAAAHAVVFVANSPEHAREGLKIMIETIVTEAARNICAVWPEYVEELNEKDGFGFMETKN